MFLTPEDLRIEIEFHKKEPNIMRRGALIAAAVKRYKSDSALSILYASRNVYDITPTLAKHILKAALGRSVSWPRLLELFGDPNRTAANKSDDCYRHETISTKFNKKIQRAVLKAEKEAKIIIEDIDKRFGTRKHDIYQPDKVKRAK